MKNEPNTVLMEHNIPVYNALEKMLRDKGKAIVVAAQGTGKSYIAQEYLEKNQLSALVICPTLGICSQWKKLSSKVDVMTYQKFCKQTAPTGYDCYIFDEAHHCGSPVWGAAVKALMSGTDKPVIGLTADSVRYLDGGRDVAYELWDGCVVYGPNPQEAIEAGILPSATYVCALFDAGKEVEKYRGQPVSKSLMARLEYSVQNCVSAIDILHRHTPEGKRKGVVFVDSIDTISEGIRLIRDAFPGVPVSNIHSDCKRQENADTLDAFIRADSGYIVSVDMLNEGVHVPGVNTIIMLRKTASPNVFMQQLGRGLAAGTEDIVVYDFVGNNCSLKIAGERTNNAQQYTQPTNPRIVRQSSQFIVIDYASPVINILSDIQKTLNGEWTPEEDAILRQYYPTWGTYVCAKLPGRTRKACRMRAGTLGVKASLILGRWTPEEDFILCKYYPMEGPSVFKRLPGRSQNACRHRANTLNLKNTKDPNPDQWSQEEDNILVRYYPIEGASVCHRLSCRTVRACKTRANKLGLTVRRLWIPEEDAIILSYYAIEGTKVSERLPGRTKEACNSRARELGLITGGKMKMWTAEEDKVLQKYYANEGSSVAERLPGRTNCACTARAIKLGLGSAATEKIWSSEEDDILRTYYPSEGVSVSSRLPKRTEDACRARAEKLEIKRIKDTKSWTSEEDEILKTYYPSEGATVCTRLPYRTVFACQRRASKLGVKVVKATSSGHTSSKIRATKHAQEGWSSEEDAILRKYYFEEGTRVFHRFPDRTKAACQSRAARLGLIVNRNSWTAEEDRVLREFYPDEGACVSRRLHCRTENACKTRAKKLGLKKSIPPWTFKEDNILREYYPYEGPAVRHRLPGRTIRACYSRANKLGVKKAKKSQFAV